MAPRKKIKTDTTASPSKPRSSAAANSRGSNRVTSPSKRSLSDSGSEGEKPSKKKAKAIDTVDEDSGGESNQDVLDEPKKMVPYLKPC